MKENNLINTISRVSPKNYKNVNINESKSYCRKFKSPSPKKIIYSTINSKNNLNRDDNSSNLIVYNESKELNCKNKNLFFGNDEIILWLEDLNIIKPNTLKLEDLPSICSTGIMLSDIINRLEGVK